MLPASGKFGVIVSQLPIIRCGFNAIMQENFPDYELSFCHSPADMTLLQLRRAMLVIVDLYAVAPASRALCEQYYALMSQYRDIHWVFMVGRANYPLAVEYLMRPESTLLSAGEPVEQIVKGIRVGGDAAENISRLLLSPQPDPPAAESEQQAALTLSERRVMRLMAKGWGINQIAQLLKKSNKTISAQKNSAMRRLSLRSNAEMYAWINSSQGMKALNVFSADGENSEWKKAPGCDLLRSWKSVS